MLPENEGSFVLIEARNPKTICCEPALLVCALRTLGVALHPSMPFRVSHEEVGGAPVTVWQWLLAPASTDGVPTGELIKRLNDPAWLAENPAHEISIVRAALGNMGMLAREQREAIPRLIIRRGNLSAHIPANASPARREWLLAKLEGRLSLNAKFTEAA